MERDEKVIARARAEHAAADAQARPYYPHPNAGRELGGETLKALRSKVGYVAMRCQAKWLERACLSPAVAFNLCRRHGEAHVRYMRKQAALFNAAADKAEAALPRPRRRRAGR